MNTYRSLALLAFALVAFGCAAEKSADPLSPTIAGPIPGVNITPPIPVDPTAGSRIAVDQQPITLLVQNATTNGPRPLNYVFEIASDGAFANKIFSRDGIAPGDSGRTSLRLSDALATGRTYYWRAKAQDGANESAYSGAAPFSIFTPIVIDRPILSSPIGNATVTSKTPKFVIVDAPRSGPVGPITYTIELADSVTFANKVAIWTVAEQPGQTSLTSPQALNSGTTYFWHARAADPSTLGPFSDTASFKTPAAVAPPPSGGGGGTPCTGGTTPLDILQCQRSKYSTPMSYPNDFVSFLKASAHDLNTHGISPGQFGILQKSGGTNCNGYSCDIICSRANAGTPLLWDVLTEKFG